MFDGLLYAAFYGFLLAFAVGPVFFTLIETAITKGIKAAIFFDLGAIFADIVFIVKSKARSGTSYFWWRNSYSLRYHFIHTYQQINF